MKVKTTKKKLLTKIQKEQNKGQQTSSRKGPQSKLHCKMIDWAKYSIKILPAFLKYIDPSRWNKK